MEIYDTDALSSYYEECMRQGRAHTFWMGKIHNGNICWREYDHRKLDGLGAFTQELQTSTQQTFDFPTIKHTKRPDNSTPQEIIEKALSRKQHWSVQWSVKHDNSNSIPPRIVWRILDKDTKKWIDNYISENGVTQNSFLMAQLNHALRQRVVEEQSEFYWAVPVNMRGAVALSDTSQNHFSVISIKASPESSAKSIHQEVKQQLTQGEHWAYWDLFRFMADNPETLTQAIQNADSSVRVGTFSNLGKWTIDNAHESDMWVFVPSITYDRPIAIGVISLNDQIGLAMHIHPSLSLSQKGSEELMDEWCDLVKEQNTIEEV